jgi:hypothetical protein
MEQKVTKATKEKLPELNRFVTFFSHQKNAEDTEKGAQPQGQSVEEASPPLVVCD